ncbi:hypothetical protein [Labedaea rhizosphaerae]|uniref:Uncharacterized protein n=1 Tax=Labedaea rhizosphaerae TaxID=598644 RepID=A0A4R6SMG4_LABRH|nr:hypothetical protein [Labedaea rhizosphaerae]TDQ05114.1 hypothetical protein EV186_1011079 [Labedaea rhizosphaerae]
MLTCGSAALAMVAHGGAGGTVPDTSIAVVLTVLVAWAGSSIAWTRYGMPALLGVLGASQLGMHGLMAAMAHEPLTTGDPLLMIFTHAVATLATAILLLRADATLQVLETAVAYLRGLLRVAHLAGVPGPVLARPASVDHAPVQLAVDLRRTHGRRGPPVGS